MDFCLGFMSKPFQNSSPRAEEETSTQRGSDRRGGGPLLVWLERQLLSASLLSRSGTQHTWDFWMDLGMEIFF